MPWDCVFSPNFQKGRSKLPSHIDRSLRRQIERLRADPFAHDPHLKKLSGWKDRFRARLHENVRAIYRVVQKKRKIIFLEIGFRGDVYKRAHADWHPEWELQPATTGDQSFAPVIPERARPVEPMPAAPTFTQPTEDIVDGESISQGSDDQLTIEPLEWIVEEELYLLEIPDHLWPRLLSAGSCDSLQALDVPGWIKWRITDFLTNEGSQVDRLYTLGPQDNVENVAQRPLRSFTLDLDPDQKAALQKIKMDGPYLIKGSAGTGKTLVGLYHIRDLIISGMAEDMHDSREASYGVLTYTNALADANRTALYAIVPESTHRLIKSVTLDSLSVDLVRSALGSIPSLLAVEGISKWIRQEVIEGYELSAQVINTVEKLGCDYVAEEIEHVINGMALRKVDEYLKADRRGRKRPLRPEERQHIWLVDSCLKAVCRERKVYTWEESRRLALQHLQSHPHLPRFSALFVDEAQDLSKVSRLLCLALVRSPKFLVMAADTAQSIYTLPVSWKSVHPVTFANQSRRAVMLTKAYRSTRQISEAISPLRFDPGDDDDRTLSSSPVFQGPKPKWHKEPLAKHCGIVCEEIRRLAAPPSKASFGQIAVIVRTVAQAERYRSFLATGGVPAQIVQKHSPIDLDAHHVHVLTAHSSKGFGFPTVFVPEVSNETFPDRLSIARAKDPQQKEQVLDLERRLLYVALSRASRRLYLLSDPIAPCELLSTLRPEDWER